MSYNTNKAHLIIRANSHAPKNKGRFFDVFKIDITNGQEEIISWENLEANPNIKRIGGIILKQDEIIGAVTFKPEHGEIKNKSNEHNNTDKLVELSERLIEMQRKNDELLTAYLETRDKINDQISEIQEEISKIKTIGQKK